MSTDSMKNPLGEIKATLDANLGIDSGAADALIKYAHSKNIAISNWNDLVKVVGTSKSDVSRLHNAIDVIIATVGTSDVSVNNSSSVVDAVNILNDALIKACEDIANLEDRTKAVEDNVSEAHERIAKVESDVAGANERISKVESDVDATNVRIDEVESELDAVSEDLKTKLTRITLDSDGSGADPEWGSEAYDRINTGEGVYTEHHGSDGTWRTILYPASGASLPGDVDEASRDSYLDNLKSKRMIIAGNDGRILGAAPDGTIYRGSVGSTNASINKANTLIPEHYANGKYAPKLPVSTTNDVVYTVGKNSTIPTSRPVSTTLVGSPSVPLRNSAGRFEVGDVGGASKGTTNYQALNARSIIKRLGLVVDKDYKLSLVYKQLEKTGMPENTEYVNGYALIGQVDLPLENMIVNAEFDAARGLLILTLGNGNTVEIPINDMVNLDSFTLVSSKEDNVYTVQLANSYGPIGDPIYIEDTFGNSDSESWKQALEIGAQYNVASSEIELQLNYIDDNGELVTISEASVSLSEIMTDFNTLVALSPIDIDLLQDEFLEFGNAFTYTASHRHFNRPPMSGEKFACILRPSGNDLYRNLYFCSAEVYQVFDTFITFTLTTAPFEVSVDHAVGSDVAGRSRNVYDITSSSSDADTVAFSIGDKSYTKTVNNVAHAVSASSAANVDDLTLVASGDDTVAFSIGDKSYSKQIKHVESSDFAHADSAGDPIHETYARKDWLLDGRLIPQEAAHSISANKAYSVIADESYKSVSNRVAFSIGEKSVGLFTYDKIIDNVKNAEHADTADRADRADVATLAVAPSELVNSSYGPRVAFNVGLPFEHIVHSVPTKTLFNTDPSSVGWDYNAWYDLGEVTFTTAARSVDVNVRDEMGTSSGSVLLLKWQDGPGDEWHTDLVVDGSVSTSGHFRLTAGNLYCLNITLASRTYNSIAYRWLIV